MTGGRFKQLLHLFGIHVTTDLIANDHIGRQGTNADTGNRLQSVFQIGGSLTLFYTQMAFHYFSIVLPPRTWQAVPRHTLTTRLPRGSV